MSNLTHATVPVPPHNSFDNLTPDVKSIYSAFPLHELQKLDSAYTTSGNSTLTYLYGMQLLPLKAKLFLWEIAFRTQIDADWFHDFEFYWTRVLGGRPLWSIHDLYFLKNLYRIKFQSSAVPDTTDPQVHLEAWQKPELLYLLLHLITKETARSDAWLIKRVLSILGPKRPMKWLEFGCSTAPIASTAIRFFPHHFKRFYFADLQSLTFHYAAYNLRNTPIAIPVELAAESNFNLSLPEKVNAIFCIQVLEHLDRPLETIRQLHEALEPGGVLIFDFILGDGSGLDTRQALRERKAVLDYIGENFELVVGEGLDREHSIGETIVRKL